MTPGETTSEKKRSRSYWAFGLIGAVVLVAAALIFWPRAGARQPLSLTVLSFSTNSWGLPNALSGTMVVANVAVTNNANDRLALGTWSRGLLVLQQTKSG